jgi:hypothetical protein
MLGTESKPSRRKDFSLVAEREQCICNCSAKCGAEGHGIFVAAVAENMGFDGAEGNSSYRKHTYNLHYGVQV